MSRRKVPAGEHQFPITGYAFVAGTPDTDRWFVPTAYHVTALGTMVITEWYYDDPDSGLGGMALKLKPNSTVEKT